MTRTGCPSRSAPERRGGPSAGLGRGAPGRSAAAAFVLALFLLAVGACGEEVVGPESILGGYTLELADGRPLPHILRASIACDELLVDGGLELERGGAFALRLTVRADCSREGGRVTESDVLLEGEYALIGSTIRLLVGTGDSQRTYLGTFSGPDRVTVELGGLASLPGGTVELTFVD